MLVPSWFLLTGFLPLHPPSLGHQVSTRLGTSSPTEDTEGNPLLHMCFQASDQPMFASVDSSVTESSKASRSVDTACLPVGLTLPSGPLIIPLTLSSVWLWVTLAEMSYSRKLSLNRSPPVARESHQWRDVNPNPPTKFYNQIGPV